MVTSLCACNATASAAWIVAGGTTTPGGKPVIAVPGLTPKSPATVVRPVLVAVEPARTVKLVAVPSDGATASKDRAHVLSTRAKSSAPIMKQVAI